MGRLRRVKPVIKTRSEERLPAGGQVPPTVYPRVSDEARHIPRHAGLVSSVQPLAAGVYFLAGAALLIHFAFNGRFGYFRDELYYAACGQHFSWGYVDHAPLAPWLAQLSRSLFGDSLFALRFFPALAASSKVLLARWFAPQVGGGKISQCVASFTLVLPPVSLT